MSKQEPEASDHVVHFEDGVIRTEDWDAILKLTAEHMSEDSKGGKSSIRKRRRRPRYRRRHYH